MALGTFGSTLNDELNRLANGGTYRDMNQMVDEALAAKQWANRENINPYSTDTVGILNEIAGLGLNKKNWLDFNGVCNYIAGTTGLPAAAALRQVYPTTDLLTGVASYYVDATAPTNWGSLGYVYFPYSTTSYLSVPDSSSLDITGDIDIRVRTSMDDWTPSAQSGFIFKDNVTGNQRSWQFRILTTGILYFSWTTDGSTFLTATSSVATGITDGAVKWIRVTMDVDNGASGRDIKFWTSDDNITWTQLGTTVTQAGTTSIYSGSAAVEIGAAPSPGLGYAGNFYQAQVYASLNGTDKRLDVNIATDWKASELASFTATTGGTVYPVGIGTISNLGTAGSLLPTTMGSSYSTDSNDPIFLSHTGTNYVYTPGTSGNIGVSVTDATPLDITGDIDLRAYVALDDWTPASTNELFSKWGTAPDRSWIFRVIPAGNLELVWSNDGTTIITKTSTVAPTIADGSPLWVRVTLDVDNGASGNDVKFFTSTDGVTYTQLGSTVTTAGVTSIYNSTTQVRDQGGSNFRSGKLFRLQLFAGLGGTDKRLDIDTSVITAGSATSLTAVTGQTVTIARSTSGRKTVAVTQPTWLFGTDDYMEVNNRYMSSGTYLYLPGVASNYASAPDSAALDVTGDIDIRVKVALDDWTPGTTNNLLSKYGGAGTRSYLFVAPATGRPQFTWSTDGTATISAQSTTAYSFVDGETNWLRVTLDVNNGAGGNDVKFFTSTDGTTWTQLGTTITTAGTTSIFSGTAQLEVGMQGNTNGPSRGKFFRAQVLNGIDGTVAFDANFETSITSLNQASFTESSANAATVTINRSGSAFRSAGITAAGYLYPGATNTFTASATDFLNFGASDSFTVVAAVRDWNWNSTSYVSKTASFATAGDRGYIIYSVTTPGMTFFIKDGSVAVFDGTNAGTLGSMTSFFGVRNVSTDLLSAYVNTTIPSPTTDTTTASLSTVDTLKLGRVGSSYGDFELYGAAVFRQALTASQIRQVVNYFANREVYL